MSRTTESEHGTKRSHSSSILTLPQLPMPESSAGEKALFSEQQMMDCSWGHGLNKACDGGDYDAAMDYLKLAGGPVQEKDYEYLGADGFCKDKNYSSAQRATFEVTGSPHACIFSGLQSHGRGCALTCGSHEERPTISRATIGPKKVQWLLFSHQFFAISAQKPSRCTPQLQSAMCTPKNPYPTRAGRANTVGWQCEVVLLHTGLLLCTLRGRRSSDGSCLQPRPNCRVFGCISAWLQILLRRSACIPEP